MKKVPMTTGRISQENLRRTKPRASDETDGGGGKSFGAAQRLPRPPYIYAKTPEMADLEPLLGGGFLKSPNKNFGH